jgi:hypothetical protein
MENAFSREQAQQRAEQIRARNVAASAATVEARAEASAAGEFTMVDSDPVLAEAVIAADAAVRKAKETLNHLMGRQVVAQAHVADLAKERKALAFSALTGDAAAQKKLDECNAATLAAGLASENLDSALRTAERNLEAAETALAAATEQQKARDTLARLAHLESAAADCDASLRNFLLAYDRLERVAAAVCTTSGHPQSDIVRVLSAKALATALLSHKRVFDLPHLAPPERMTFAEMTAAWGRVVRGWAAQRLGKPPKQDKAA